VIWVFGDSFSANKSRKAWATLLEANNLAYNGSCEYRIWKTYYKNKHLIHQDDLVIFCHTSESRVFLKDSESILSRLLKTHPFCDLIFKDVFTKNEHRFMNILNQIWDKEYFADTYKLLVDDLIKVPNSIHINFFKDEAYKDIRDNYPGKINHMSSTGNLIVYNMVVSELQKQKENK